MKVFKIITLVTVLIATVSITNAQNSIYSSDKENVVAVMKLYKDARLRSTILKLNFASEAESRRRFGEIETSSTIFDCEALY